MVEKALPSVVLFERRYIGAVAEPAVLDGETEHAFECCEFSIDTRVRRLSLLPISRIRLDSIGRDVDGAVEAEKFPQMTDRETCRAQRAPAIELVVGKERLRQVIKRQSVLVRPAKPALGNFADPLLQ